MSDLSSQHQGISENEPPTGKMAELSPPGIGYHGLILFASCLVIAFAALFNVHQHQSVHLPYWGRLPGICVWKNCFQLECPGCGLTRCFVAIAHGNWSDAWQFNPAGFLIFAVVLYQIPFRSLQLYRLNRHKMTLQHPLWVINLVAWTIILALLLQWFAKHVL